MNCTQCESEMQKLWTQIFQNLITNSRRGTRVVGVIHAEMKMAKGHARPHTRKNMFCLPMAPCMWTYFVSLCLGVRARVCLSCDSSYFSYYATECSGTTTKRDKNCS